MARRKTFKSFRLAIASLSVCFALGGGSQLHAQGANQPGGAPQPGAAHQPGIGGAYQPGGAPQPGAAYQPGIGGAYQPGGR
jgi:hypothetical protein